MEVQDTAKSASISTWTKTTILRIHPNASNAPSQSIAATSIQIASRNLMLPWWPSTMAKNQWPCRTWMLPNTSQIICLKRNCLALTGAAANSTTSLMRISTSASVPNCSCNAMRAGRCTHLPNRRNTMPHARRRSSSVQRNVNVHSNVWNWTNTWMSAGEHDTSVTYAAASSISRTRTATFVRTTYSKTLVKNSIIC